MTTTAEAQTYAPEPLPENVEIIDVDKIRPSKTNPRKHDKKPAPDFVESVRVHGVMQPIIVVVAEGGGGLYDIVFGEMRWTASKMAGRTSIRAIVRDLDRDEIFEAQIIENSQRKDVHPLDESDAFAELVKRGYEPQRIADRIGRPVTYVALRLKLRELGKEARGALDAGRITLAVALQIARVPEKLQKEALDEVAPVNLHDKDEQQVREVMTSKGAAAAIRERFMLRLVDARFDITDVTLVPKAGPCSNCPKRTGNQGELFADVDSPDLCTDPECFRAKTDAHWKITTAAAKKSGQKILTEKEAKELFPYRFDEAPRNGRDFVDLNGEVSSSSGRSLKVKALLGKDLPTPALVRNPHTGKIFELVPKAAVDKALKARQKAKGSKDAEAGPARKKLSPAEKAKVEREKLKKKAADEVNRRASMAAAGSITKFGLEAAMGIVLPLLIGPVFEGLYGDSMDEFLLRYGVQRPKQRGGSYGWEVKGLEARAAQEPAIWSLALLLELALFDTGRNVFKGEKRTEEVFKKLHVDRKAIEAEVVNELKAGKDPSKPSTEGVCRECGCTDSTPCTDDDGEACGWTEPDLCSACAGKRSKKPAKPKKRKAGK